MAEKFEIKYYYMGQGDCILIVCPNGKLVMIDCGSAKGLYDNEDLLLDVCTNVRKYTSKNSGKIDILILTHKDKDHYNQVMNIFSERSFMDEDEDDLPKVNIDTVYFSSPATPSASFAMTQFSQNSCGNSIIVNSYKTKTIKQVFINNTEQKVLTYTKGTNFRIASGTTAQIKNYKLTLLSDTTPGGKKWSVSIIAGQVPETPPAKGQPKQDPTNALSLCTLLQFDTSKALFLGDATIATEKFLMKRQKALIKDLDFVHIPHHGSRTSSSQAFVDLVNPKGAEVTHETFETGNRLPKENVLDRWIKKIEDKDDVTAHAIDSWEEIKGIQFANIIARWKKNKYSIMVYGNTAYILKIPKGFRNNYVCVYRTKTQYWGLYRSQSDTNLWGTGADDFNKWTLPL